MKHMMALIVYNGKDKPVFRKDWELPNASNEAESPAFLVGAVSGSCLAWDLLTKIKKQNEYNRNE